MAQDITSPFFPLCERNALWIVEDYTTSPGSFIPFLHFGTVDFKNALAGLPGTNCHGPNSPEACTVLDATQIFDIVQNSKLLTFTSVMDLDEPILTVNNFIYD
ncbi:hypothetical protein J3R82DRAFT_2936 [Butyriboletus roseoflavus]|nr:hypothetical protein J3R82DRAFT_2936 [Butyriboletus roseoflavus]